MRARRLTTILPILAFAAAWAAIGAAADGGPSPGVSFGSAGIAGPKGELRYVALPSGSGTLVEAVSVRGGKIMRWAELSGGYGIPLVAYDGSAGGLTPDGKTLVLASFTTLPGPEAVSRFAVFDTRTFRLRQSIVLTGTFSYDAISPDGSTVYLIQYTSTQNANRYRVRAYDLAARKLLPRVIVDRREPKEPMTGSPMARVTSRDGGWVYTLYSRVNQAPFVHALDARHREAVCLDLDWHGSQAALSKLRLSLSGDGRSLMLLRRSTGARVLSVAAPG